MSLDSAEIRDELAPQPRMARRSRRWRRFLPLDREGAIAWCFLAISVAFNARYLFPEVAINAPKLNDGVLHTLLLQRMIVALRGGQDPTDPWFAPVTTGYPVFHYYQHLPYVAPALVGALFHGIDAAALINWSSYLLLCAFPISVYWSMRRFGFPRIAAASSALLAPLISTNYLFGFDYNSYVWIGFGVYTQLWGMVLLGPALAQGYRTLRYGGGYFLSVLLVAAVVLSHLVLGYIALVSLVAFVFLRPTWPDVRLRTRRALLLLGLVALVTSYFLIPVLRDNAYLNRSVFEGQSKYDAFGYEWTMRSLIGGRLFDYGRWRILTVLVGIGVAVSAFRWRDERYRAVGVFSALWLLMYFGRPTWGVLIGLATLNTDFYVHRLISGVHLGGILLMGIGLAIPWQWALARKSARYLIAPAVITALLLLPVYKERREYLQSNESFLTASNSAYDHEQRDIHALEGELRKQPPGRVYAGLRANWGDQYRVGEAPMSAQLNSDGFDMIGYLYFPFSVNSDIQALFNEQRVEQYNLFDVRYVVAPKDRPFPPFVTPIGDFGRHRLYRVSTTGYFDLVDSDASFNGDRNSFYPAVSNWLTSGLVAAGEHPRVSFEGDAGAGALPLPDAPSAFAQTAAQNGTTRGTVLAEQVDGNVYDAKVQVQRASYVMLKETYHPNWHAYIDGREAPAVMLMPSYVAVKVTPGPHNIRFEYRSQHYRWALLAFGLLALPLIALAESENVRRRWPDRLRWRRSGGGGRQIFRLTDGSAEANL